jgi:hypothetical protein
MSYASKTLQVGDRVHLRPLISLGTIRYIEDGAACVKWDDLPMVYTYKLGQLHLAPVKQPNRRSPRWAEKLQKAAR